MMFDQSIKKGILMSDYSKKEKRCSAEELLNLPNGIILLILRGIRPPDMDYNQAP